MNTRVRLPVRSALVAATAGLLTLGGASAAYAGGDSTVGDGVVCPDGTTPDTDLNEDGVIDEGDCPTDPDGICPDGTTPDTDLNEDGVIDEGDCPTDSCYVTVEPGDPGDSSGPGTGTSEDVTTGEPDPIDCPPIDDGGTVMCPPDVGGGGGPDTGGDGGTEPGASEPPDDAAATGESGATDPVDDTGAGGDIATEECVYAYGSDGCTPDPAACYDEAALTGAPRAPELTAAGGAGLPVTGSTEGPLALAGASCVLLGLILVATRRRRTAFER